MRKIILLVCIIASVAVAFGQSARPRFSQLTYNDGLSDSKVNCIVKSRDGFLWIGTPMGLNRYDGFRVRSYYNRPGDPTSLPDNVILSLAEDADGMLWVETASGYCIFNPRNDRVERDVKKWMMEHGMKRMPVRATSGDYQFADSHGGRWRWSAKGFYHYDPDLRSWHEVGGYIVRDVAEDKQGNILIATDHDGLLVADSHARIVQHIVNDPADPFSLPDNTPQCLYVDDAGVVWIGMYRMGLAWYYHGQSQFGLLHVGDICTMAQAPDGSLWLGTNDSGLRHCNPSANSTATVAKSQSHLGSDVVVASLNASDGSLWFGTFQGGMARLKNGTFTPYRQSKGELASNDVWALAEIPHSGLIAIGTLGGGLQLLDTKTGRFTTFSTRNTRLPSDYIATIAVMADGRLALGHSLGVSIIDWRTGRVENIDGSKRKDGGRLASLSVNQVYVDSRGLLWIATGSGLNVYDAKADRLYNVNLHGSHVHEEVCAIAEDQDGLMWLTSGNELKSVGISRSSGSPQFFINTYTVSNGLQSRLFNKRAMLCLRDGRILVGGIDGVNVVDPRGVKRQTVRSEVLFSGLTIFDRPIAVGDTINGHVVLTSELNSARRLRLRYNENTFTILLASSCPGIPDAPNYFYRVDGGQWLTTSTHEPSVQFTNLPTGSYTLEVRAVGGEGNSVMSTAQLHITILPPFYLSVWAWIVYIAVAVALVCYLVWRIRKNHRDEMEKLELRKQKEIEEAKMTFFTNISHELRTPLSLILSPVESMLKNTTDQPTRQKLRLVERNAHHLLMLTNQMLDLRRVMRGKETLRLEQNDIVAVVRSVCAEFAGLSDKGITLTLRTERDELYMAFDKDKVEKIVANLLSNAYKFTPKGGRVSVSVATSTTEKPNLIITVADTGVGITDDDKKHIFERFYQSASNKQGGGSGIGLNLVWEYARMHGGSVSVADGSPSGTVFTISLPMTSGAASTPGQSDGYVTSFGSTEDADSPQPTTKPELSATVLLVDDNDDFLSFLAAELSPYYNVQTAHDGQQALDSIHKSRPDLVLTDIMMPVMDGNELCRRIKADKELKGLPVVMLTARLSDENEIESRECGADDYVKKPFSLQLLRMRIDTLLGKNRLDHEGKVQPRIAQPKITSEDEKFVDKATAYVEQHMQDAALSVEQMAADMGMSRVQLYRRLVSVAGKTPSEFIRLVRLRHAARLLRESQMTVSEIAYKVGFSSPRYFSRCFKELFGYMPTEYKRT